MGNIKINTKTLLTAAALAVAMTAGAGAANAAPWNNLGDNHRMPGRDMHRVVDRTRVFETLRLHHYRWLGDPVFMRGHYVVKVMGHFGRPVFIEVDPYTGAFIGEFRV